MDKHLIIDRVKRIAADVTDANGVELVNVDIGGTKRDAVLRIYIDKEGGVTLDDCSTISREVEAVLDAEDPIPSRYVLEVSSPGIERELYSISDFVKFTGRLIKVKTREAIDGQKTFVGPVTSVDDNTITIEDRTRGAMSFEYVDVDKANLKIDLSEEFGRK